MDVDQKTRNSLCAMSRLVQLEPANIISVGSADSV